MSMTIIYVIHASQDVQLVLILMYLDVSIAWMGLKRLEVFDFAR